MTTTLPSARLAWAKSCSSGMGVGILGESNMKEVWMWMRESQSLQTQHPFMYHLGCGPVALMRVGVEGEIKVESRIEDCIGLPS